MRKIINVTEEYINASNSGKGRIIYGSGYNQESHSEEINIAMWIVNQFGGDITLVAENAGVFGVKSADFEWNNTLWELKTLKSEKSIDSALRKAIGQIYDKPGGVILDFGKNQINMSRVKSAIKSRVDTSCRFKMDIIIITSGQLAKVLRCE